MKDMCNNTDHDYNTPVIFPFLISLKCDCGGIYKYNEFHIEKHKFQYICDKCKKEVYTEHKCPLYIESIVY